MTNMNNRYFTRSMLAASMTLVPATTLLAQQDDSTNYNHFRFSARAGFNVSARFKNLGALTLTPSTRTTPDGSHYNYDNGYVLTDVSGSAGGQTWNWGYDAPSQISGNTILMSRSTPDANTASSAGTDNGDANLGWEIDYDRELGTIGKWRYGIEAAINWTKVGFNDHSTISGNVNQTTDAYAFTPGTTPPSTPPAYQGTFNGPGFLLGSTPISSRTTTTSGALVVGQRQFNSDIWGIRLGPYFEYPLTKRLDVSLSAGLAAGVLVNSASWNEVIYIGGAQAATSVGSGNNTGFVWGGYASADLSYQFTKHWSAEAGVQFQDLGVYQQNVGSRAIELDLSKSLFATFSIGCKF
jgi:hypothetical protein